MLNLQYVSLIIACFLSTYTFSQKVDFLSETELIPFKKHLPKVKESQINTILNSKRTMWYDRESMTFVYQDSQESVVGLRENKVAYQVGIRNRNIPDIFKLVNFFDKDGFKAPFKGSAGMDNSTNSRTLTLWYPPEKDGSILPVKYWRRTNRSRWNWVFPVGTVFLEVIYTQAPNDDWFPFEVRTRERYEGGWSPNSHRPFNTASSFASAIKAKRSDWASSSDLSALITHLENTENLIPATLETKPYDPIVKPISGYLDVLPDANDPDLIMSLLSGTTFSSAEGTVWKRSSQNEETYAPSTEASFHIVPIQNMTGLLAVNETSCNRCHTSTGKLLGKLEDRIVLYGEIWGEDEIFTWHLFKENSHIHSTWDDSDVSRVLNQKLVDAGLVIKEKVTTGSGDYWPITR